MRTVTVYASKTRERQTIETDVTTWGELLPLIDSSIGAKDADVTIRETRTSLQHPDAQLPEGDFLIFVYPKKVKSGMSDNTRAVAEKAAETAIRNVVKEMKAKFDDMFQEILDEVDNGNISVDIDALDEEAHEIAFELGINLD
jgi:hypothetical protein